MRSSRKNIRGTMSQPPASESRQVHSWEPLPYGAVASEYRQDYQGRLWYTPRTEEYKRDLRKFIQENNRNIGYDYTNEPYLNSASGSHYQHQTPPAAPDPFADFKGPNGDFLDLSKPAEPVAPAPAAPAAPATTAPMVFAAPVVRQRKPAPNLLDAQMSVAEMAELTNNKNK